MGGASAGMRQHEADGFVPRRRQRGDSGPAPGHPGMVSGRPVRDPPAVAPAPGPRACFTRAARSAAERLTRHGRIPLPCHDVTAPAQRCTLPTHRARCATTPSPPAAIPRISCSMNPCRSWRHPMSRVARRDGAGYLLPRDQGSSAVPRPGCGIALHIRSLRWRITGSHRHQDAYRCVAHSNAPRRRWLACRNRARTAVSAAATSASWSCGRRCTTTRRFRENRSCAGGCRQVRCQHRDLLASR